MASFDPSSVLPLIAFALIFLVAFFFHRSQGRKISEFLEYQRVRRGGTISRSTFFHLPEFTFDQDGVEFSVCSSAGGKNRPPKTTATAVFELPSDFLPITAITVYRESMFSGIGKSLGMQDIHIGGGGEFDQTFIIKGINELFVREVLNLDVQQTLLRLKNYEPTLLVEKYTTSITVPRFLKTNEEYTAIIDATITTLSSVKRAKPR